MQERWSSNVKLVHVEDGLPQEEDYVPSKKDGNANKNYVKSMLCTKVSLFLLLLCLVGLSSYLLWQTPQRPLDDDDDEDIPENPKSRNDEVTSSWLEDKIWEYDRNVANETQHDDSNDSSDPYGEVEHTTHYSPDDSEENTSEISSRNEQLDALVQKFMSENSIPKLNTTVIPGHDNMDPLGSDLVSLLVHIALRGELGMAEKPKEPVEVEEEEEEEEQEEEEEAKEVSNEEEKQSTDSDSTTEMDSDSYDSEIRFDDDYYEDYEDIWGYSRGRRLREHRLIFLLG